MDEATIHVLSHVVSYGSSVFEGIRCYSTPAGPAVFGWRRSTSAAWWIRPRFTAWSNLGFSPLSSPKPMLGTGPAGVE